MEHTRPEWYSLTLIKSLAVGIAYVDCNKTNSKLSCILYYAQNRFSINYLIIWKLAVVLVLVDRLVGRWQRIKWTQCVHAKSIHSGSSTPSSSSSTPTYAQIATCNYITLSLSRVQCSNSTSSRSTMVVVSGQSEDVDDDGHIQRERERINSSLIKQIPGNGHFPFRKL